MESANLNREPSDETALKVWYARNTTPLPDNGFTARVLASLPPQRSRRSVPTTVIAVAAGALAGIAFAVLKGASLDRLAALGSGLQNAAASMAERLVSPTFTLAVGVTAFSLLISIGAVRYELWRR